MNAGRRRALSRTSAATPAWRWWRRGLLGCPAAQTSRPLQRAPEDAARECPRRTMGRCRRRNVSRPPVPRPLPRTEAVGARHFRECRVVLRVQTKRTARRSPKPKSSWSAATSTIQEDLNLVPRGPRERRRGHPRSALAVSRLVPRHTARVCPRAQSVPPRHPVRWVVMSCRR